MATPQATVTSRDGTRIAFERVGTGAPLILVSPALGDRSGSAKLARLLARNFTVINYDRRGRGESSGAPPYAVEREVEDIEALVAAAGGTAHLFGSSSGAVLALEAAARLGSQVRTLLMYEPPSAVAGSAPAHAAHHWETVTAPALVMVGGASPGWIQHAGQELAALLPHVTYRVVEGADHSALTSAPQDIATTIYGFFLSERIGR